MVELSHWQDVVVPQRYKTGCIPTGYEWMIRYLGIKGIDLGTFQEDFDLVVTRGPSFIDEYSLNPENYLLDLVQAVESWDDDGIDHVIKQLARNKHVDAEAIERLKQWDAGELQISNYYWQQIKNRLDDMPKIREEMKKEKELFFQSGNFKKALGLGEETSIVVTKEMLEKRRLDKLKKELSDLNNVVSP